MKNLKSIISGRFSLTLAVLIVLLALVSLVLGWVYFELRAWITFTNLMMVWFLLVYLIFYNVRKANRELARFFEQFNDQDSAQYFDLERSDPMFTDLHRQMNRIISDLSAVRSEKEKDYQFFRTVFNHADAGLIVYNQKGKIMLINKAASALLSILKNENISELISSGKQKPGMKILLKLQQSDRDIQLSVRSTKIKISGEDLTLLSLQNIRQELELHEMESWQKLIRVFIHEIMNSVSPITLTSSGIIAMLEKESIEQDENQRSEILDGLKAIRKRSKGISAFMESYKKLTRIPIPDFNWVDIARLSENIGQLLRQDFLERNVSFHIRLSQREIKLWCDEKLLEQALINLLRNAGEALSNTTDPEITLSCVVLHDRVEIIIKDNGPGIDPGIIENIFVPFFTTKSDGTGIGLSLSRQIVNLHGARISVHSKPGETIFTLSFPDEKKPERVPNPFRDG